MCRRIDIAIAGLIVGLTLAQTGCGGGGPAATTHGPGSVRPPVVVGSEAFTEQRVLGEVYAQALRAKGFRVRLKPDLPGAAAADRALIDGRIDGYPEYLGAILDVLASGSRPPAGTGTTYRAVRALEAKRGMVALPPTPFERADALATTTAYARARGLTNIGDLARVGPFALGAPPKFDLRTSGLPAVRRAYGTTGARFTPLSLGTQYAALDSGRVQVAAVITTDPRLRAARYAVLADPRDAFGAQNVVPVFSRAAIAAGGPAFAHVLDAVSARLTIAAVRGMNAAVEQEKRSPADVARRFLQANGLL